MDDSPETPPSAYERRRPARPDDPWAGRPPLMRRPLVRAVITLIAVGSFLLLTLMSTSAPRRPVRPEPTTTTTEVLAIATSPGHG